MPAQPRLGIVGLGGIGTLHAKTLSAVNAAVAGGADPSLHARREFEETFDVPTFETHSALFDAVELDGVIVTTPNQFHRDAAVEALARSIPVLVEKPLADTLSKAREIAAAAASTDAFCMVGFHNRFSAPARILHQYIDEGRLGKITHVEANYIRRRGIPGRGSWFTTKAVAGGGSLIDVGVHVLDMALSFLGYPRELTVLGAARTNFGDRGDAYSYLHMWGEDDSSGTFDVDDSASAFIRADSGASIALEVAWAANRCPNHTLVVRGTKGGAEFDIEEGTLSVYETAAAPTAHHSDVAIEVGPDDAYQNEQQHFVDAIAAGESPTQNTVDEGLLVQQVVDAIYHSSEAGTSVSLDTPKPKVGVQ